MNALLKKRGAGQISYGTFTQLKSSVAIENIACAGFDYVIIDSEHASLDAGSVYERICAAELGGITPLVRICDITRSSILRALDAGAKGLIVPAVETVDQVRELIRHGKFAPVGKRGYMPTRDNQWGARPGSISDPVAYMAAANQDTLLIPQCETAESLECIEEIAALEGVDGIFVGPLDLSISMGIPMQLEHPAMQQAIRRVLKACQDNDKLSIIFAADAQAARRMALLGYDSVTLSSDILVLTRAYQELAGQIQEG